MTWTGPMCISSADASRDLEKKKQVMQITCTRRSGWDIYHIDVDVCMFTEFCKWHFNVKLFNYIFDTLFFFNFLQIASNCFDFIRSDFHWVSCLENWREATTQNSAILLLGLSQCTDPIETHDQHGPNFMSLPLFPSWISSRYLDCY